MKVLKPYVDEGIVGLYDWPYEIQSHEHWIQVVQWKAIPSNSFHQGRGKPFDRLRWGETKTWPNLKQRVRPYRETVFFKA